MAQRSGPKFSYYNSFTNIFGNYNSGENLGTGLDGLTYVLCTEPTAQNPTKFENSLVQAIQYFTSQFLTASTRNIRMVKLKELVDSAIANKNMEKYQKDNLDKLLEALKSSASESKNAALEKEITALQEKLKNVTPTLYGSEDKEKVESKIKKDVETLNIPDSVPRRRSEGDINAYKQQALDSSSAVPNQTKNPVSLNFSNIMQSDPKHPNKHATHNHEEIHVDGERGYTSIEFCGHYKESDVEGFFKLKDFSGNINIGDVYFLKNRDLDKKKLQKNEHDFQDKNPDLGQIVIKISDKTPRAKAIEIANTVNESLKHTRPVFTVSADTNVAVAELYMSFFNSSNPPPNIHRIIVNHPSPGMFFQTKDEIEKFIKNYEESLPKRGANVAGKFSTPGSDAAAAGAGPTFTPNLSQVSSTPPSSASSPTPSASDPNAPKPPGPAPAVVPKKNPTTPTTPTPKKH
jgi:hypothetical protein